jgi:hypothetical protein
MFCATRSEAEWRRKTFAKVRLCVGRALEDMCSNLLISLGAKLHLNTRPGMYVTQWRPATGTRNNVRPASDTFGN